MTHEVWDRVMAAAPCEGPSVFVTVGTTRFDALVRVLDGEAFQRALRAKGFVRVVIQRGRGEYVPREGDPHHLGLHLHSFDFAPSMAAFIHEASLVISHAGSGSIFESLRAHKPLLVVVNESLMDNHQRELADALTQQRHLLSATPSTLVSTLMHMDTQALPPYPPQEAQEYARDLDGFLGFK